MKDDGYELTV